ncbi:MAG: hypothetical protein ACNA8W_12275 [Bradymonadaceae bacterium]
MHSTPLHIRVRLCLPATLVLVFLMGTGCASYTDHIREAQQAIVHGQPSMAVDILNKQLDVDRSEELPAHLKKNNVLLLLERATLLQALGHYELAARDMSIVDQHLDWLDIDQVDSVQLARYLYSDSSSGYRAPPYERLMLNTLNMINFLAMGALDGARVEARRFHLMERFFLDEGDRAVMPQLIGLGYYLAGASFEASRDYDTAARHYTRAWVMGVRPGDLRYRLIDLIRVTGYQGRDLDGEERKIFMDLLFESDRRGAMTTADYRKHHQEGDTLIIVQSGLVPYRQAERIPIGAALAYSRRSRSGHSMTVVQYNQAQSLSARGLLKWVNFPTLTSTGLPSRSQVRLSVGPSALPTGQTIGISQQVSQSWNELAGSLMAAAITRLITRAIAGEASRAVTDVTAQSQGMAAPAAGVLGWLAGMAVEGSMAAADTPDTRSWTTLPAGITLTRVKLERGMHMVEAHIGGQSDRQTAGVFEDRFTVVNFSRLR